MPSSGPTKAQAAAKADVTKLPRVPHNARILKRPLFHPAIPSANTGPSQQKVIYISHSTPFMSAATRVRKMLEVIEKRTRRDATARLSTSKSGKNDGGTGGISGSTGSGKESSDKEPMVLKATSRAIEKALGLAMFFQNKPGYEVRISTGTVSVVDDVVEKEGRITSVPETRVRRLGCVEVAIRMS
ncbi:MAG: hypothetical protein M1816_000921 [Peltula sp. TS41687]|nr:MAG: hypothetical protein M1816_000921 [Peltula sp. TS41687]